MHLHVPLTRKEAGYREHINYLRIDMFPKSILFYRELTRIM